MKPSALAPTMTSKALSRITILLVRLLALLIMPLATMGQQSEDLDLDRFQIPAVKIDQPIQVDGLLDEQAWSTGTFSSQFTQYEPQELTSPTEKTDFRILYDDNNIYVGIHCFDSKPGNIVATEMRRDSDLEKNDRITLIFDTFHDHRNGFFFAFNPAGCRVDGLITDEGRDINRDWNAVWQVKTSTDQKGWHAEVKIPLRNLRFQEKEVQTWGFNLIRLIRRKNESVSWTPLLRDYGFFAMFKVSKMGQLTNLRGIKQRNMFQIKPYGLTRIEQDVEAEDVDFRGDAGLDMKYSLTSNLIADITVNTDFAQVEADEVQVNLSRFSLFFPEKREFFLEGAGIFRFGERSQRPGDFIPATLLFFSRRIGLAEGTPLPILGGAKITGKIGGTNIGLINMQVRRKDIVDDGETTIVPSTNFTTVRVKRDVLSKSSIGLIFLNKQVHVNKEIRTSVDNESDVFLSEDFENDYNRVLGFDANFSFFDNMKTGGYIARSYTPGIHKDDWSYYGYFDWRNDLFSVDLAHLSIQDNFNPEMGFLPREDIKKSKMSFGFSPRPKISFIRQMFIFNDNSWYHDQQNRLISRDNLLGFFNALETGGHFFIAYNRNREEVVEIDDFEIREDRFIPPAVYINQTVMGSVNTDPSRKLSGELTVVTGTFYSGNITSTNAKLVVTPNHHLSVETSLGLNRVTDLPVLGVDGEGRGSTDFYTTLVRSRWNLSLSPDLYTRALIQWNSDSEEFSVNFLFHWIYKPGSDFYVVYNEFWEGNHRLHIKNRALIIKMAHLFQL